jgi:hypothetical protein
MGGNAAYFTLGMRHILVISILGAGTLGCVDSSRPLSPDLYLTLSCEKRYVSDIEDSALVFFRAMGLSTLNRGRLMREHYANDTYGAEVIGIDGQGTVIVEFRQRPFKAIEYAAVLYSLPPTVRKTELEGHIEQFANQLTHKYSCRVSNVERHENGPKARETFIHSFELTRGWYEQVNNLASRKPK